MRYLLILMGCFFSYQALAQSGFKTSTPVLHFSGDLQTPRHFSQIETSSSFVLRKPFQHQYPATLNIIDQLPRREYIIKNGPEKKLYYNDGNRIIETCIGPVGMSCSFYLW